MKKKPIIILGSSKTHGDTQEAVDALLQGREVPIVDLLTHNISYYDYAAKNKEDDFISIAEKMMQHDPIILATPVYWYTMSAPLKTFLDRWSDLLTHRKDLGRSLANKELYVVACYGNELPKGFEDAFSQTCGYLDMKYKGCYYYYSGRDPEKIKNNTLLTKQFAKEIYERAD